MSMVDVGAALQSNDHAHLSPEAISFNMAAGARVSKDIVRRCIRCLGKTTPILSPTA